MCRVHDNSSLSHISAMPRPRWLRRAVRNRHRHAIEQASRRWRGGRRDDSSRTRRELLISTQVLRIPCAFVTHYGRAIDDKTPLLRSQDAVAREGLRLLKACGVEQEASTMYAYLGWEQEFFVAVSYTHLRAHET